MCRGKICVKMGYHLRFEELPHTHAFSLQLFLLLEMKNEKAHKHRGPGSMELLEGNLDWF